MLKIDAKTFNPEILYIYDPWNCAPNEGNRHAHSFIELSVILEGEAEYIVEGRTVTARKGTVFLFNPCTYHQERQLAETYSHEMHIGFRNFSLDGYDRNYFPFKTSLIDLSNNKANFFKICDEILAEKADEAAGYDLMMKSLVMNLLVLILRSAQSNPLETHGLKISIAEKEKKTLVNNIIYYLEKHHTEEVSLETLSETMYISPTYISRVFKEETGNSPINYLINIRLNRAKEMLETNQVTVKEAAETVGYQDAYYFSKLFKKHYGKSPSEFAKKISRSS